MTVRERHNGSERYDGFERRDGSRRLRRIRPALRAVLAALLLACAPAAAQEATDDLAAQVERARELIFAGRPLTALALLRPLARRHGDDTDVLFFRGMAAAAAAAGEAGMAEEARRALHDEAVASYRRILEGQPDLAGARLELARVLFERGRCLGEPDDLLEHLLGDDCDAAAHHFRRALAGDLPPDIAAAVERFLAAIRARKRVSGSFDMALAPDSNVNAGTSARSFPSRLRNVFTGEALEFDLDEQARETSGVGAVVSTSGEYRHPLAWRLAADQATRLRLGVSLYRREYRNRRFDDMTLEFYAGPQLLFPRGHASLLARVDRRWFGGEPISYGFGPRLEGLLRIGDALWLGGGAERILRRHRHGKDSDGPRTGLDANLTWEATPALALGLRGGLERSRAMRADLRLRTRRLGAFVFADLPPVLGIAGFGVGVTHDVLFTRHDEAGYFLISPAARRDRTAIWRLTASSDRLELFGFVPSLSLVHERRRSNIASIFDYRRNRAELSMRRLF